MRLLGRSGRAVWLGEDGLIAAAPPGSALVTEAERVRRRRPRIATARHTGSACLLAVVVAGVALTGGRVAAASNRSAPAQKVDGAAVLADNVEDHDEPDDRRWRKADERRIDLTGDTAEAQDANVDVEGSTVTIRGPGTYRVSGRLDDGRLIVRSPGNGIVRLVLDGVSIHSSSNAPIAIFDADKAVVVLVGKNVLGDEPGYEFPSPDVDEPNAALFSAADLTIAGRGTLSVEGNFNDGIASKDGLVVVGATLVVVAVDDGIRGRDYVVVKKGSIEVDSMGDGLKADNDEDDTRGYIAVLDGRVRVNAGADGFDATTDVVVLGGSVVVANRPDAGGSTSASGLKGGGVVVVEAGSERT